MTSSWVTTNYLVYIVSYVPETSELVINVTHKKKSI